MPYRIEFVDDLMTITDDNGDGFDAFEVDPQQPWDAVETLAEWGREYDVDPGQALRELRRHLRACR
jgi:hypothetical protein